MSILRIKDGQGNLINIPTHAIETPILDLSEYYDSENVEGALREIGQKIHSGVATPKEIEALIKQLDLIQSNVKEVVRQEVGKLDFSDIINLDTETLNEIIEAYKEGSLGSGGSDGGGSDSGSSGIDEEKFYELLNSKLNVRVLNEMTDKYLNGEYIKESHKLDLNETIENEFILGLRKIKGINKEIFKNKYNKDIKEMDIVNKLIKENKLLEDEKNIYINPKYIYVSNDILIEFIN